MNESTTLCDTTTVQPLEASQARASLVADFAELSKVRIVMLTAFTSGVGYVLASPPSFDYLQLAGLLAGCMLGAAGASAFNHYLERDVDAMMQRTRLRPLPAGRMHPTTALAYGFLSSALGLALTAAATTLFAALLLALTIVLYAAVYTPLKRLTSLSTIIGAIPGAMPTLIGWAGADRPLDFGAATLFAVMFFWQLPHFISIGWVYREDYARAGLPMLTVLDRGGRVVARQAMIYAAALLMASMMPALAHLCGSGYLVGATLLGTTFLALNVRWALQPTVRRAYWVFFGSLAYHALLFSLMLVDRVA